MADSLDFDAIEAEAKKQVAEEEKKAASAEAEKPNRFKNWTKGPIIIGAIVGAVIIGAMLVIAFVL